VGDILINFDFDGNGVAINLENWDGLIWSPPQDLASTGKGVGAVNSTSVNNPFSKPFSDGSIPTTFEENSFGEAAINVTAALPTADATLRNVWMRTRSSASSTNATLGDVVQPVPIDIPLKGEIKGTKFNDLNANGTQDTGATARLSSRPATTEP
jgi:hypothetical protein